MVQGPCVGGFQSLSVSLVFLLLLAAKADAQASGYITATGGNFGFAGDNYPNGPSWKSGVAGFTSGAFYNFLTPTRWKFGLDARGTYSPGHSGGRVYTGAMRVSFIPERHRFRPYAELGGGYATTQFGQPNCIGSLCGTETHDISGGVLMLNAGLDIRATPQLDIRVFDYTRDTAGSAGFTSPAARSFSAGVVFHRRRPGLSSP